MISAKYISEDMVKVIINNITRFVPVTEDNADYRKLMQWVARGNTIEPADPEPTPPTNAELVDALNPIVRAFFKVYAQREGVTMQQLKNAIVQEMS